MHVVRCDVERAKCGENPWKLITIRARFTDAVSLSASSLTFVERLVATDIREYISIRRNFHGNTEMFARPLASDGNRKSFGARLHFALFHVQADEGRSQARGEGEKKREDFRGRCWKLLERRGGEEESWRERKEGRDGINRKRKGRGIRIWRRENFSTFPRRMNDSTAREARERDRVRE